MVQKNVEKHGNIPLIVDSHGLSILLKKNEAQSPQIWKSHTTRLLLGSEVVSREFFRVLSTQYRKLCLFTDPLG